MGKARKKIVKKKNIRNYSVSLNRESKEDVKKNLDEMVSEALRSGLKINYLGKSRKKGL